MYSESELQFCGLVALRIQEELYTRVNLGTELQRQPNGLRTAALLDGSGKDKPDPSNEQQASSLHHNLLDF